MPHALFVINSLADGGAERVLLNILSRTPPDWDSQLILLDTQSDRRQAPTGVALHRLDARDQLLASFRGLHRKIRQLTPDLVVSFLVRANVASALGCRLLGVPCIISERAHLSTHLRSRYAGLQYTFAKPLVRSTYRHAQRVIAVSEGVRRDLIDEFGLATERVRTIPNPYDLRFIASQAQNAPEVMLPPEFIVSVGRLTRSKGIEDLIAAYAHVSPQEHLCIVGDGEDRQRLSELALALGVAERVHFLGYLKNPFAVVSRAKLYVSASRCEGFPNALAEAMALGVPGIAADCPSGPAELLNDTLHGQAIGVVEGKYGVLAPVSSPVHLAEAIRLMQDPNRRAHYALAGRSRLKAFDIDTVSQVYWSQFSETLDRFHAPSR